MKELIARLSGDNGRSLDVLLEDASSYRKEQAEHPVAPSILSQDLMLDKDFDFSFLFDDNDLDSLDLAGMSSTGYFGPQGIGDRNGSLQDYAWMYRDFNVLQRRISLVSSLSLKLILSLTTCKSRIRFFVITELVSMSVSPRLRQCFRLKLQ
jgi:hypothetical protein